MKHTLRAITIDMDGSFAATGTVQNGEHRIVTADCDFGYEGRVSPAETICDSIQIQIEAGSDEGTVYYDGHRIDWILGDQLR